jgi:hypothetical protein
MLSKKEIKRLILAEYDSITLKLVEAARNGDAHYSPHAAIKECAVFLADNPHLQRLEPQAAAFYKLWEKDKIPPTTKKNEQGQLELGFDYKPQGVIIYGRNERGFMRDMTFFDVLRRQQVLQTALKHTTDGIHAELSFYNERLQRWDQARYKTIDSLMREVFGWKEESLPPQEDSESDEDEL